MFLARVGLGENDHTRCIAMQKVTPSNRTNLALSEKPSRWDGAQTFFHGPAIMMGLAEESLSAPATAEQKSSEWGAVMRRSICSQEEVQIVTRGFCIAKVKLHGLAFLNDVSDCDSPGLLICSDEVANEEIAPFEMTSVLIDHNAQVQCAVGIAAL